MGTQDRHQRRPTPGLDRIARFGNALWYGADPDARERGSAVNPRRPLGSGRRPDASRLTRRLQLPRSPNPPAHQAGRSNGGDDVSPVVVHHAADEAHDPRTIANYQKRKHYEEQKPSGENRSE